MRIIARRDDLLAAAQALAKIADRRNSIPIIGNVLLRAERGELLLAATDLNITGQWPIGATIKTEGAITVAAKPFVETLKGLPKGATVTLTTEEQYLTVECGEKRFKVVGMAARDFPKLPAMPAEWFHVSAPALYGSLAAVVNTISTDETRYHLNGACLSSEGSTLTALATDGHRLARDMRDVGGALPVMRRIIVPRSAVKLVTGLLRKHAGKAGMGLTAGYDKPYSPYASQQGGAAHVGLVHFRIDDFTVTSKLIEAQFPPTEQVEYTDETRPETFRVDAGALANAAKRARLVAPGKRLEEITLCVLPGVLRVSSGTLPHTILQQWVVTEEDIKAHAELVVKWEVRAAEAAKRRAKAATAGDAEDDEFDEKPPGKAGHWEDVEATDLPLPPDAETQTVSSGTEWFSEDIAIDFNGTPRACSINASCLLEPLAKAEGSVDVGIDADDPLKPVSVVVNGRSHVVMPMRGNVAPVVVRPPGEEETTRWTWAIGVWPAHGVGLPYEGEEPAAAPAKARKVKAVVPTPAPFEDEPTLVDPPVQVERPSVVTMTCGECVAGIVRIPYNGGMREMYCNCWYGQQRSQLAA